MGIGNGIHIRRTRDQEEPAKLFSGIGKVVWSLAGEAINLIEKTNTLRLRGAEDKRGAPVGKMSPASRKETQREMGHKKPGEKGSASLYPDRRKSKY